MKKLYRRLTLKCPHCGLEFKQRFGREECCSRRCASFLRESRRKKKEVGKPSDAVNSFLTGRLI